MEFLTTNPYTLALLVSSTVVLIISIYISQLLDESIRWLSLIMLSLSVWGFFYGIELTQSDLETILFFTKVQYLGITQAPAAWVLFSLKYTGYQNKSKKWILNIRLYTST